MMKERKVINFMGLSEVAHNFSTLLLITAIGAALFED